MIREDRYDFKKTQTATAQEEGLLWIDAEAPNEAELSRVAAACGVSREALSLMRSIQDRAPFQWHGQSGMFSFVSARLAGDEVVTERFLVILSPGVLATVREGPTEALSELHREWREGLLPRDSAPAHCFYLLADGVTDGYQNAVGAIGERIDSMGLSEETLDFAEMAKAKEALFDLSRLVRPMKRGFHRVLRWQIGGRFREVPALETYYRHLSEHLEGVRDDIRTYHAALSGASQDFLARRSEDLNRVVTRLTIATIVLSSWSVIVGFYGMNVGGVFPSSDAAHGVAVVIGLCAAAAGLEAWYFQRRQFGRMLNGRDG